MTERRSRCPGRDQRCDRGADPSVWSMLTVEQTKVAAEIYRQYEFVWMTGSWRFTPKWAESVDACLDLMVWETKCAEASTRYAQYVFEHCGTLYSGVGSRVACEAYEYTNRGGHPVVRVLWLRNTESARAILTAHEYIEETMESGGFSQRRNRIAFISSMIERLK
jgi:hypothetical protein